MLLILALTVLTSSSSRVAGHSSPVFRERDGGGGMSGIVVSGSKGKAGHARIGGAKHA